MAIDWDSLREFFPTEEVDAMQAKVSGHLTDAYKVGGTKALKDLGIGGTFTKVDKAALAFFKNYSITLSTKESQEIISRLKVGIMDGLIKGKDIPQISRDIRPLILPFRTKVPRTKAEFNKALRMRAQMIARTECYDSKTEVLTSNGWKHFEEVLSEDKIATLNNEDELEYQEPLDIINYPYEGKMFKLKNTRSLDLMTTPNHNLYVRKRNHEDYQLIKANGIYDKQFQFKRNAKWNCITKEVFKLPSITHKIQNSNKEKIIFNKEIKMDDWLEFLGYYLSEGSTYINGRNYSVTISQSKEASSRKYNKIENCLKRLPFKYSVKKDQYHFSIYNKQLAKYLKKYCGSISIEKKIPKEFLELNPKQLKILYKALMLGDGTKFKGRRKFTYSYSTISKQLADDFQELLLKIGLVGNVSVVDHIGMKAPHGVTKHLQYIVRVNRSWFNPWVNTVRKIKKCRNEWVDYKGMVGCVTVPNGVIYTRRNGKPMWCGNCQRAANMGRKAAYKAYGVKKMIFMTGPKPCPVCADLEARTFSVDEFPDLPLHPNCVCTGAAVT